jgi:hypothetical protein
LKQRGIEVVNLSAIKKYPEYQGMGSNTTSKGQWTLKDEFVSGHAVPMNAYGISDDYLDNNPNSTAGVLFGGGSENNYQIFYPAAVPGLNYVQNVVTLFKPTDYPLGDNIVSKSLIPVPLMEAAAHEKLGVITAAFEVELVKYGRERTDRPGYTAGFAIGAAVPMVRTKLATLNMLPQGTEMGTFFSSGNFTQGLRITTKHRGIRHGGMRAMFDAETGYGFHWVEVDDGSVVLTDTEVINPVPAKFPAAFKKATDGNLQMIMYAIDHPSDF